MHHMETELDVAVPMRDGTVLRADVYRPGGNGRWPVLLQRTPYDKRSFGNWLVIDAVEATQRGYIVVHQDTRGRFASDGDWLPWAHERDDGYDSVEWAASIEGSNGKVGMIGASYTGSTQWSAALTQPPSLVAIAPAVTWSDPADGLMFRGGAIELGLNAAWGLWQALGQFSKVAQGDELAALYSVTGRDVDDLARVGYWELPAGELPAVVRSGQPDIGVARALADPSTLGDSRVTDRYDEVKVPTLNVAGWYDVFQQGSLDNYTAMAERGVATRLVVGPWTHGMQSGLYGGHMGELNFGGAAGVPADSPSLTHLQLDWFDRWFRGGAERDSAPAPVKIFVMGVNRWRDENEWPLARAVDTPLYLVAEGELGFDPPVAVDQRASFDYDPADPVLTRGGAIVMASEYPAGPIDQRETEARLDVLVFTTAPMGEDLEVTGRIRARLFAETDSPSTDWVVRVCDVYPDGRSINIVDGIARVAGDPNVIAEHVIDLWSTSIVFRAGHRIRVHVTSSNFPRWDRNLNTGEPSAAAADIRVARQTVHFDASRPSHIVLPIVAVEGSA